MFSTSIQYTNDDDSLITCIDSNREVQILIKNIQIMLSTTEIAVIVCLGLLFLYHIIYLSQLYGMASENSLHLNVQRNRLLMDKWVIKYSQPSCTTSHHYTAIHALRNIIYVGIFLGTFTITAAYDAVLIDKLEEYRLENVILGAFLFASFLCWVQVVRNTNHLSIAITSMHTIPEANMNDIPVSNNNIYKPIPSIDQTKIETLPQQTESSQMNTNTNTNTMNTTSGYRVAHVHSLYMARNISIYYSFAFRFLYCGIPFVFFAYGHVALYTVTAAIIFCEIIWDYGTGISEFLNPNHENNVVEVSSVGYEDISIEY